MKRFSLCKRHFKLAIPLLAAVTSVLSSCDWQPPKPLSQLNGSIAPEVLYTAGLDAAEISGLAVAPGGWWDDRAEFAGTLEPGASPSLQTLVIRHVVGLPASRPSEILTALSAYVNSSAAAAEFERRADTDYIAFGKQNDGPSLGDKRRYMRIGAADGNPGSASLRVLSGRYLFRIEVTGEAAALPNETLARLASLVLVKLGRVDAGTMEAPSLPRDVSGLPKADMQFTPIMGTATSSPEIWSWQRGDGYDTTSPELRRLLLDGVGQARAVSRRYGFAGHPGHVVDVVIMPFISEGTASAYYNADLKINSSRKPRPAQGVVLVTPPQPGKEVYIASIQRGKYVAEIACSAPYGDVSTDCENAVRDMAKQIYRELDKLIASKHLH